MLHTLDRKLAAAIYKQAHGELGRQLTQRNEDAIKNELRTARGRELYFLVLKYYSTGRTAELMYSVNDLQAVRMRGDQLEAFGKSWKMVLAGLPKLPDTDILEFCYFQQVAHHKGLAEDVAHYNRAEEGTADHSYEFLIRSVERYLQRQRQIRMREQLSKGLQCNALPSAPGVVTPGDRRQAPPMVLPRLAWEGKGQRMNEIRNARRRSRRRMLVIPMRHQRRGYAISSRRTIARMAIAVSSSTRKSRPMLVPVAVDERTTEVIQMKHAPSTFRGDANSATGAQRNTREHPRLLPPNPKGRRENTATRLKPNVCLEACRGFIQPLRAQLPRPLRRRR